MNVGFWSVCDVKTLGLYFLDYLAQRILSY